MEPAHPGPTAPGVDCGNTPKGNADCTGAPADLDGSPSGRRGGKPAERRGQARYQDPTTRAPAVRYVVKPAFDNGWALLVNVSAGGVGLLLGHEAAPGAVLLIQLTGPRPGEALHRRAHVVHARAMADGYWVVGCEFARPLADDELAAVRWELGAGA